MKKDKIKPDTLYLCECGKKQTRAEMKRELDYGYDQLVCYECNDVLIDDLRGFVYVKKVFCLLKN